MAIEFFGRFDKTMTEPVVSFMHDSATGLSQWVSTPFKVAAILYILTYGYMILTGAIAEPMGEFIRKCIKIGAIAFLLDAGNYAAYVSDFFFTTLPNEIGSAINSKPVDASSFDSILNAAAATAWDVMGKISSLDPSTWAYILFAAIIVLAGALLGCVGYAVSLLAKVGLAIVLAIGLVFVALYLFKATRRFTDAFIGQIANYVILQILVVALGTLIMKVLKQFLDAETKGDSLSSMQDITAATLQFSTLCVICAIIFFQLPGIAASLAAGGSQIAMRIPRLGGGGRDTTPPPMPTPPPAK